jgi:hypothetical protein
MQIAMWVLWAAVVVCYIGTQVVRGIVNERRLRRDGLGGTFDVFLWGSLAMLASTIAAIVGCHC